MADNRIPVLQIDTPLYKPGKVQPSIDEVSRKLYTETHPNIVKIETSKGSGSGFPVLRPNLIVTDYHCISDSNEVKVRTADGKLWKATVIDIDDINDLALLEIQGEPPLKPYQLGDDKALAPEQKLTAFGHPHGLRSVYLSPGKFVERIDTTTPLRFAGGPSVFFDYFGKTPAEALANPRLTEGQKKDLQAFSERPLLYARVQIRPGNSGGPLLTDDGKVIGIAAMGAADAKYSHSLFTPASQLKSLVDRPSPHFQFQHELRGAEWTHAYGTLLKDRPLLTASGTAATGYVGYRWLTTQNSALRGTLPGAIVGLGAYNLRHDFSNAMSSVDGVDRLKYGLATAGDTAMLGGGAMHLGAPLLSKAYPDLATKALPRAGKVGLGVLAVGAAVRYGSDFIPNRVVRTTLQRADGDNRPPFRP